MREALHRLPYADAKRVVLREFTAEYARELLDATQGNVSAAARLAGRDRSGFRRLVRLAEEKDTPSPTPAPAEPTDPENT